MTIEFQIAKGDLSDFVFVRPEALDGGTIDGNWSCSGVVFDVNGRTIISEFPVTDKSDDNTEFKAYITASQSEVFSITAVYTFAITIENSTTSPPIVKTTFIDFQVIANESL